MSKRYQQSGLGGTVELGKGGANIKDSSGVVEARTNADDGYAVVRGATPVGNNDLATKSYVDGASGSHMTARVQDVEHDGGVTTNIGAALTTGQNVIKAMVNVNTVFDGTTPTLDIGISGDTDAVAAAASIDLTTAGLYVVDCFFTASSDDQIIGTLTVSGATQGSATVVLELTPA